MYAQNPALFGKQPATLLTVKNGKDRHMSEAAPQLLTSEDIFSAQFPATKFRDGYDQNQIDDYLDEVVRVLSYYEALNASPEAEVDLAYITVRGRDVREVDFDYTRMRVGYDQDAVDDYLDQVAATLEAYEKLYGIPPSDQRYQVLQVDGAALEAEAAEQAAASGELPSSSAPNEDAAVTPIEIAAETPPSQPAEQTVASAAPLPVTPAATPSEDLGVSSSILGTPTGSIPVTQPVPFEQAVLTNHEDGSPAGHEFDATSTASSPLFPPLNAAMSPQSQMPETGTNASPVESIPEQNFASAALPETETPIAPSVAASGETAPAVPLPEPDDEWGEVPQYPVDAPEPQTPDATAAQTYSEPGYDPYQPYEYDAYDQPMSTAPAEYQGSSEPYPEAPTEAGYPSPYGTATPESYDYPPQAEGENQAFIPEDTTMVIPVTPAAPVDTAPPTEVPSEYAQDYEPGGYPEGDESSSEETPDYDSTFAVDQEEPYDLEESLDDDYPEEITLDDAPDLPVETTDVQADSTALQEDFYAPATPEETPVAPVAAEPAEYYAPESVPESMSQPYVEQPQSPYAAPESPTIDPLTYATPEQPATADSWQTPNPYQAEGFAPSEWDGTPQPTAYEQLDEQPSVQPTVQSDLQPTDQYGVPDFSANEPAYATAAPEMPEELAVEQPEPTSETLDAPTELSEPVEAAEPAEPSFSTFQMPQLEAVELGKDEVAPVEVNDAEFAPADYSTPSETPKAPLTDVVAPPLPTPGVGLDLGQIREKLAPEQVDSPAESEQKLADVPGVLMTPTRRATDLPPTESPTESPAAGALTEPEPTGTATEHLSATRLEELAAQNAASVPETAADIPMIDTQSEDNESTKGQPTPIFPDDSNPRPMLQGEEPLAEVDPDGRFIPHFLAGYRSNLDTFTSVYGSLDESGSRVKPASIAKLEAKQHRKSITTGYLVTVATSRPLGADDQVFVRLPDGREVPVTSASSDFDGVHLTIPKI
ncbi:DivIVA domain-containing protein [Mobiluncus curtisii]|uniref:DivIVA domain-containing protein n=1 Tax=Mobiluncus curtisii TaxID=2051 RepID=UPI001470087C|nr:DivIVA domain-containing protein [Mobiluncus curtisii]